MGLNDPQWGKKKGADSPPDLDDVLRNVNKKISDIFGKKGGDGGNGGSRGKGPRQHSTGGIMLLIGILLVAWIASGFYIVNEGHRGVVLRFGEYVATTPAGLRWHMPFPIEQV